METKYELKKEIDIIGDELLELIDERIDVEAQKNPNMSLITFLSNLANELTEQKHPTYTKLQHLLFLYNHIN